MNVLRGNCDKRMSSGLLVDRRGSSIVVARRSSWLSLKSAVSCVRAPGLRQCGPPGRLHSRHCLFCLNNRLIDLPASVILSKIPWSFLRRAPVEPAPRLHFRHCVCQCGPRKKLRPAEVLFHIKHHSWGNQLASRRRSCILPDTVADLALVQLTELASHSFFPEVVAVLGIQHPSFLDASGNTHSKLVGHFVASLRSLASLDHSMQQFRTSGNPLQLLPARSVKWVVFLGVCS